MGAAYYAVARGRLPGVYSTWAECEQQVKGFSGACYKKFATLPGANGTGCHAGSVGHPPRWFDLSACMPVLHLGRGQDWLCVAVTEVAQSKSVR